MKRITLAFVLFVLMLNPTNRLFGHCDTMNGPVVTAAKKALETGNVNLVLIWVKKSDEAQIKEAFTKTLAVRKLSPEAMKLADMYFFETLVRIHRAGEGVPYTGLKAAETNAEPGVEAADQAIEHGTVDNLIKHLTSEAEKGIRAQFARVEAKKNYSKNDVEAGREYVEAYVVFIHYVDQLYQSVTASPKGHLHESAPGAVHDLH